MASGVGAVYALKGIFAAGDSSGPPGTSTRRSDADSVSFGLCWGAGFRLA